MANVYESAEQKNIPAVLVYLRHGGRYLMIHRDSPERPGDFHAGKWNGLGGKCERGESYLQTAVREIREESGVELLESQLRFAGFLQFPNFKPRKSEDWSVMLFTADVSEAQRAQARATSVEGSLHWVEEAKLLELNLWPGDREFLPHVRANRAFIGCTWYRDGAVERSDIRLTT